MTPPKKQQVYIEGIGARKTASARVRIMEAGRASMMVNGKPLEQYFQNVEDQKVCMEPLERIEGKQFEISVKVHGGGIHAQAQAVRHGLARALVEWKPELRLVFKVYGYLKRDARMRERKKFGLRRARRARQWRKR